MPRDFPRTRRVGEQLQRELAQLVRDEVDDPRLGMVSISGVEVSRDLSHAKVFFSTLGTQEEADASLRVLQGAASRLRHLLGQQIKMRNVPQLHFKQDQSIVEGACLSALIDKAVSDASRDQDDPEQEI